MYAVIPIHILLSDYINVSNVYHGVEILMFLAAILLLAGSLVILVTSARIRVGEEVAITDDMQELTRENFGNINPYFIGFCSVLLLFVQADYSFFFVLITLYCSKSLILVALDKLKEDLLSFTNKS